MCIVITQAKKYTAWCNGCDKREFMVVDEKPFPNLNTANRIFMENGWLPDCKEKPSYCSQECYDKRNKTLEMFSDE